MKVVVEAAYVSRMPWRVAKMNAEFLSIVENIIHKCTNIDMLVYVEHVAQCTERSLFYIIYVATPLQFS